VIPRKPLPSPPFIVASASEPLQRPAKRSGHLQRPSSEEEDETLFTERLENTKHLRSSLYDGDIPVSRKPIGPRPFTTRLRTADSTVVERKPVEDSGAEGNARQRAWTDLQPQIQSMNLTEGEQRKINDEEVGTGRSLNTTSRSPATAAFDHPSSAPPLPPRPSLPERPVEKDFHITIIRRDPTSGGQWNTGTLSRERRAGQTDRESLRIEIRAPGYQRFARKLDFRAADPRAVGPTTAEHKGESTPGTLLTAAEAHGFPPKAPTPSSAHFEPMPFTRDITLNRPSASRPPKRSHRHQRSSSSESFPFSPSNPTVPTSPSGNACLSFSSPWQGICTFITGMDGRSLKCRHELPPGNCEQGQSPVLAAELRFNLPWSALRSRDANASRPACARRPNSLALLGEDAKHSFKKGVARVRQEIGSTSSDTDIRTSLSTPAAHQTSSSPSIAHEDSDSSSSGRLDLKLGQERAGGGRKGKSAKLGKLVLRDEGLKMADLVVAACMGVWWDVYWGKGDTRV
jgi:hypothetical protein